VVFTPAPEPLPVAQPVAPVMPPKRKGIPWWGWTIIAVFGIGFLNSLGGGAGKTSSVPTQSVETRAPSPTSPPSAPTPKPPTAHTPAPSAAPPEKYDLLDETTGLALLPGWKSVTGDFGTITVKGKIKNTNDRSYSYAQVQFKLWDKEGSVAGTAMANINNLGAGETWAFEAVFLGNAKGKYKVGEPEFSAF
jgi:hypothetical protein